MGVVTRMDTYGASSFVRALGLVPDSYLCVLHFFHSDAWSVEGLMRLWWQWLGREQVHWELNGRLVFTGDHTKTPKDARKMPAVTTMHQDSETASKPSFFRGHHWGCIAMITHVKDRFFSTPLWAAVHEGLDTMGGPSEKQVPKTVRIVHMAQRVAQVMGQNVYLVLDAYFSVGTVFLAAATLSGEESTLVHILTRAKKNVVAHLPAPPKNPHIPGPKPLYGEKLKLYDLFELWQDQFTTATTRVYGQSVNVRYYSANLLWKPVKGYLRFFWFDTPRGMLVLMTSDLSLLPLDTLEIYCRRTTIETLFNTLKNVLAGMTYHFWSKYLKRVSRRPFRNQEKKRSSAKLPATIKTLVAIEKYVNLHFLAIGMLQLIAMHFSHEVKKIACCWMRTEPKDIPSEFIVKIALTNMMKNNNTVFGKSTIMQLIRTKQQNPNNQEEKGSAP